MQMCVIFLNFNIYFFSIYIDFITRIFFENGFCYRWGKSMLGQIFMLELEKDENAQSDGRK